MKTIVKISFLSRSSDLDIWYSQFFSQILSKKYIVDVVDFNPDFIFHESHLIDVVKFSGVRIAFSGENVRTDFNISDYGIGFDHLSFQDRYLRFPLYLLYTGALQKAENRPLEISLISKEHLIYRKFCNFLVSNGSASEFRTLFFNQLSEYKKVDSGGKYLNNLGIQVENKFDWQTQYKFSICFENSSTSGYLTEKLIQAYAANTIPIYWGDPDALGAIDSGKGGINPKAIIYVDKEHPETAIEQIVILDNNPDLYYSMLLEPLFLDDNHSEKFFQSLEKFLFSIFSQPKENAYRRGFGQIRTRVEQRVIARSSFVKSVIKYLKRRVRF